MCVCVFVCYFSGTHIQPKLGWFMAQASGDAAQAARSRGKDAHQVAQSWYSSSGHGYPLVNKHSYGKSP